MPEFVKGFWRKESRKIGAVPPQKSIRELKDFRILFWKKNGCHLPITAVLRYSNEKSVFRSFSLSRFIPLISRLRASFPPRGSLLRYLLDKENINFFSKARRIQNLENKIAHSNRIPLGKENISFFRKRNGYRISKAKSHSQTGFPLGGSWRVSDWWGG